MDAAPAGGVEGSDGRTVRRGDMRRIVIGLCAAALLAGCGDPLRGVPRLDEVPASETAGQADVVPNPDSAAPAPAEADKPRGGLLGFLRGRADAAKAVEAPAEDADAPAPSEAASTAPARRGLFGLGGGGAAGAPSAGAPDAQQVSFGTALPYGQIARVCDAPVRRLGQKTESYPERGRGYTLYDSAPGSEGQRTFYLTGFSDGCPRQFTAALAIFGDPESYEQIRYGPAGASMPRSVTDSAYEKVKNRVCRVRTGKPCGRRMSRLARNTVFVSVYERFGSNPRWKDILLHDGEVIAVDVKG